MLTIKTGVAYSLMASTAAGCIGQSDDHGVASGEQALTGGSSEASYLVPLRPGVTFQPLLSVGDAAAKHGYRMVGIPDGLGAWGDGDKLTLLMNHELGPTLGAVHDHGARGAFVSRWRIDKSTGEVLDGRDLIQWVVLWNPTAGAYDAPAKGVAFSRFCSGNLAPNTAFFDDATGLGYDDHLYMNGEEIGNGGRAFAHDVETGVSYELPRLGKAQWENHVARPHSGATTVVAGSDDTSPGEITLYVGTKTASGSPVDRAGLTDGTLLGLVVAGYPLEPAGGIPSGTAVSVADLGDVSSMSFTQLQALESAAGVTAFNRPEDIAWNPANPDELYFATTASFTGSTRLWRVTFADGANPAAGGTIDLLIDGNTTVVDGVTPRMFDNITVTGDGRYVYLQEDPGNQAHLAKIWRFDLGTHTLELLAQHDPARFSPLAPAFLTADEESSGIIDASAILGPGKLLLDVQVHRANPDPALVEYGQLLVMTVTP